MKSKRGIGLFTCAFAVVLMGGCSQRTINSANSDVQHDANVVGHAAKQVVSEAKPQLRKVDLGMRVSAALTAAKVHGVRVDSSVNGVTLVGSVKSAAEKKRALQIARDTLSPHNTISDRITVR